MFLERLLQINVAMLVTLATFMLALPQRTAVWPLVMLAAAMTSFALTDVAGKIRLPQIVANLAVTVAFVVTVPRMLHFDRTAIITAIGELLMCAQLPIFFQQKHPRLYMQLIMLAFLQVVVASAMSQGTLFAILLVLYLFTAISALALLHLHRERLRFQGVALPSEPAAGDSRWPLARLKPAFASLTIGRAVVQRELFWRVTRMGLVTLVVSTLVFFVVPRLGGEAWRGASGVRLSVVGFSKKIRLGDLGRVLEDRAEVLRIAFRDRSTGEPYAVEGSVYLRGAVVDRYQDGQWEAVPHNHPADTSLFLPQRQSAANAPVVQVIRIEPMQEDEFFCVWPFYAFDERLRYDGAMERVLRSSVSGRSREPYQLGCGAFERGRQADILPNQETLDDPRRPGAMLLQMPDRGNVDPLAHLRALADRWLEGYPAGPEKIVECARLLERQLRDSGMFRYSLQGQARERGVDPIEDFVSNTPSGHCEYFAGALALMLRSRGIPARVVLGYRTEDWNEVGGCFRVRQLNAHAWVEVFLRNSQIPEPLATQARDERWNGAWLRLDATPSSADAGREGSFWTTGLGKRLDWLDFAWRSYVLEMDRPRQREAVYSPVVDKLRDIGRKVADPQWWRALVTEIAAYFGWGQPGNPWFHWRAFAVVVIGGLSLFALAAVLGRLVRRRFGRGNATRSRGRGRHSFDVEFYRRMETLLARLRIVRPASVTQRAFAADAGSQLALRTDDPHIAPLTTEVAEAFYRVRFGGEALDKSQADSVEQALVRLERAVRKR